MEYGIKLPLEDKFYVLLAGRSGSGKNFYGERLKAILETLGASVALESFARPLKEMCDSSKPLVYMQQHFKEIFYKISNESKAYILEQIEKGKICPIKKRRTLQNVATEMRKVDDDVFVFSLLHRTMSASEDIFVITDLRFKNEARFFRKKHSLLAFLDVPTEVRVLRSIKRDGFYDYEKDKHESEASVDEVREFCDLVVKDEMFLLEVVKETLARLPIDE